MDLLDGTARVLRQSLSGLSQRQQLIANNLANVDTPEYRALDTPFEQVLNRHLKRGNVLALATTSPAHMTGFQTLEQAMSDRQPPIIRTDGNGVDVDAQMEKLAESAIQYNATAQLLTARLSLLRSAATEGKR